MSDNPQPPMKRRRKVVVAGLGQAAGLEGEAEEFDDAHEKPPEKKRPAPNRGRKGVLADPLTGPFLICLVVGSALSVFGHVRGFEVIGLFGPILAAAAYPIWGVLNGIPNRTSLRERFADNAYYLGFIFTQVALLAGFGIPALTGQSISSADVLRFFGVAIGASMTGLVARTLLVQTGHTVVENADIVQDEVETLAHEVESLARGVSDRTRGMLADLDAVAAHLGASRQAMSRELDGWLATVADAMQSYEAGLRGQARAFDTASSEVGRSAKQAQAGIDGGVSTLADRIGAAVTALDQLKSGLGSQVSEAARSIEAAKDSFVGGVEAVNRLQADMGARMAEATAGVQTSADALGRGADTLRGLSVLDDLVGALDARVSRVGEQIDRLGETVQQATREADGAGDAAVEAVQAAIETAKARAEERAERLGAELDSAVAALESVLERFREELKLVRA